MADREVKLVTRKPGSKIKPPSICLWGRGGVGKTTTMATYPGRGLVIETPQPEGGGDLVLKTYDERIAIHDIEEWADIDDAFYFLKNSKHDFKWVGFDTLTGMKQLAIRRVIKERDISASPHKISPQEWGTVGSYIAELIYRFETLPLPVIYVCQEKRYTTEDDEGDKQTYIGPEVTPASLAALQPVLLVSGRLTAIQGESGGWERKLRHGPSERFLTKSRSVDPRIEIPSAIRIGSPPTNELYMLVKYLLGQGGIESLDVINETTSAILTMDAE